MSTEKNTPVIPKHIQDIIDQGIVTADAMVVLPEVPAEVPNRDQVLAERKAYLLYQIIKQLEMFPVLLLKEPERKAHNSFLFRLRKQSNTEEYAALMRPLTQGDFQLGIDKMAGYVNQHIANIYGQMEASFNGMNALTDKLKVTHNLGEVICEALVSSGLVTWKRLKAITERMVAEAEQKAQREAQVQQNAENPATPAEQPKDATTTEGDSHHEPEQGEAEGDHRQGQSPE